MIRITALAAALVLAHSAAGQTASLPASQVPPLPAVAETARGAWERRDLAAFLAAAGGGRLLVSLPAGKQSSPVPPDQANAILSVYVQGTEEVATLLEGARQVDSTRAYVQLLRRYRLVGAPGERESLILLGYRRGREMWVLTEVRIAS